MIDLSAHALQVAVKQHEIRPPMTKLTGLYPRNLLVLVIEMWETDPSLVKKNYTCIFLHCILTLSFLHCTIINIATFNEPRC